MKCPYRKIIEKVKTDNTETLVEDFMECVEDKCPRYFKNGIYINGELIEGERCDLVENAKRN